MLHINKHENYLETYDIKIIDNGHTSHGPQYSIYLPDNLDYIIRASNNITKLEIFEIADELLFKIFTISQHSSRSNGNTNAITKYEAGTKPIRFINGVPDGTISTNMVLKLKNGVYDSVQFDDFCPKHFLQLVKTGSIEKSQIICHYIL